MGFFVDADEVDCYVGSILRLASRHPIIGPRLATAATNLRILLEDPACEFTVELFDPTAVRFGPNGAKPDVTFRLSADRIDQFWRGDYNLLDGLASGEVSATGPVSRVLKVIPHVEALFGVYRSMVTAKDVEPRSVRA